MEIREVTFKDLEMVLRHADDEKARISAKQPRKAFDAFAAGMWDGVRLYSKPLSQPIAPREGDTIIIKTNKNLGTKKWPDVRETYLPVRIEKVCPSIYKCTDGYDEYRIYPENILAIVRG